LLLLKNLSDVDLLYLMVHLLNPNLVAQDVLI
jgi:hypothetical protein